MEYNKIIAVTGLPGLYELLSSKSDGAIVRSLDDKSTKFVSNRIHNFSHLESIEIFTVKDNVNLVDVLNAMGGSGEKLPDEKDAAGLKKYFSKVYPDMDFERVYPSDLKKMVKWFSVLKANQVEIKLTEPEPEEEEVTVEAPAKKEKAEKPAAKKAAEAVKAEPVKETKPAKEKAAAAAPSKKEEKPKSKAKAEEEPKPKKAAAKKAAPKEKEKTKSADKSKKAAPAKKKK